MTKERSHARDERGASAVEYGLIAVAIAAVVTIIVFSLGHATVGLFQKSCDGWTGQDTNTGVSCS